MTTSRIIKHEGRTYDLYKLEIPIGLLVENARPVFKALMDWPHGMEFFGEFGLWYTQDGPALDLCKAYRAKPAPKDPLVERWGGKCWVKMLDTPHFNQHNIIPSMTYGNWTATLEDGKPVRIVWEASK